MELGLIELLLVFVGVLGLAVWDLLATRSSIAATAGAKPAKPPKSEGAVKPKKPSRSSPAGKPRRPKSKVASN